jgi:hypothetical protein
LTKSKGEKNMRPYILEFAEEQVECPPVAFHYDDNLSLNVIDTLDGPFPVVEVGVGELQAKMGTLTRVEGEGCDASVALGPFMSKTFVEQEQDDR